MLIKNRKYLLIIGIILLIIVIIFSYFIYINFKKDLFLNLLTEVIGIIITVFLIDFIIEKQREKEYKRIAKYTHKKIFGTISGFYFQLILLCDYPLINKEKAIKKPLKETTDSEIVKNMEDHVMTSFKEVKFSLDSYVNKFNVKKLNELKEIIESTEKILKELLVKEGSKLDNKITELIMSISEHTRKISVTYLAGFIELKHIKEHGIQLDEEQKEIINRCSKYVLGELKELIDDLEILESIVKKDGTITNN